MFVYNEEAQKRNSPCCPRDFHLPDKILIQFFTFGFSEMTFYAFADVPRHSCLSVTVCEPSAMSEAVVMEASSGGSFLQSSCAVGDSSASLNDAIVDTAK